MMAQDVEVAPSFQPLLGLAANFLRSHESQVADPMIEAQSMSGAEVNGTKQDAFGIATGDRDFCLFAL